MILPTYPGKIPQTSPNPHKERNSFINCWWNFRGIFQGYVGEILESWHHLAQDRWITIQRCQLVVVPRIFLGPGPKGTAVGSLPKGGEQRHVSHDIWVYLIDSHEFSMTCFRLFQLWKLSTGVSGLVVELPTRSAEVFLRFSFDATESCREADSSSPSAICTESLKSKFSASCRAATSATCLQRCLTTSGKSRTHVFAGLPDLWTWLEIVI